MKVIETISEVGGYISGLRSGNRNAACTIGLVPTMGALHEGHLSLVREAKKENLFTGVSIFVNPIQFNDPRDLEKYPRDLDRDLSLLESVLSDEDFVFTPNEKEMYPGAVSKIFDFGQMANVMEGAFRPGHFNGVGIVVEKLFRIITPDRAYFGEKDYQQVAIIRKMSELENLDINIISCPIIREENGLAMSSRNQRLSPAMREEAGLIYAVMNKAGMYAASNTPEETSHILTEEINSHEGFEVEYLIFADERSLQPVNEWKDNSFIRCFAAVKAGPVRLIDNIKTRLD